MAQTNGKLVMRMADADVLPYDFAALADTLHLYTREVKALLDSQQTEATEQSNALEVNAYVLTSDPKHPTMGPPKLVPPPFLNFAPLENALAALDESAAHFNVARTRALGGALSELALNHLNDDLIQASRKLTNEQGLPGRPWMRNLIYAPGQYTGYQAKTLPAVREAIEQRRYGDVNLQISILASAIADEANYVEYLASEL